MAARRRRDIISTPPRSPISTKIFCHQSEIIVKQRRTVQKSHQTIQVDKELFPDCQRVSRPLPLPTATHQQLGTAHPLHTHTHRHTDSRSAPEVVACLECVHKYTTSATLAASRCHKHTHTHTIFILALPLSQPPSVPLTSTLQVHCSPTGFHPCLAMGTGNHQLHSRCSCKQNKVPADSTGLSVSCNSEADLRWDSFSACPTFCHVPATTRLKKNCWLKGAIL